MLRFGWIRDVWMDGSESIIIYKLPKTGTNNH